jgi:tetratricopeptide (TPR) repeat protein
MMRSTPSVLTLAAALAAFAPSASSAHHTTAQPHDMAQPGASAATSKGLPLYTNLGTWHHTIQTRSPRAQQYFDQGLRMVYAFNHDEAIAAFEEAERLDPACAMAPWGVALASGPNINLPIDSDHAKVAYAAIARAESLSVHAAPLERELIAALATRYSKDGEGDRKALDVAYADAMREVAQRHEGDDDTQVLFAEAMMNLRPWDHWTHDGQPQPGTGEIMATLERVLARTPQHPGANHYYIHTVEASPHPEKALAAADRLPGLMPGAGHLVHMPAHIYERTGRYADGVTANTKAIVVDEKYIADRDPQGVYPLMYYSHNIHFLWAGLCDVGKSAEAIRRARQVAARATPDMIAMMPMIEFVLPTTCYALARFGKWEEILAETAPPPTLRFTSGMWHYARGLALAATGKLDQAAAERDSVDEIGDAIPEDFVVGINAAKPLLRVAGAVLAGDLAYRAKRWDEAIAQYEDAVRKADDLKYDEPPAWYQPPRQYLGKALLDAGRPADAERVYREDLAQHPELAWSLMGLAQALAAEGKTDEAKSVRARYDKAWAQADVKLTSSRF